MVALLLVLVGQGCGSTSSSQPQGTVLYELGSFVLPQREPGSATLTGAWLEVSRLDGSGRRALTPRPARRERRADGDAAWSPDGSRVAFVREALPGGAEESGRQALYVVGIGGSHLRKLVEASLANGSVG